MHRHFTATALVIDDAHHRALLLWHKRLQRWMPPGGHMEPNELPEEAAAREAKEETGLDIEIIGEPQEDFYRNTGYEGRILKKPFAFFLESIPPCPERSEPEHEHIDFIYIAHPVGMRRNPTLCAAEHDHIRWFTAEEIAALDTAREIYVNVQRLVLRLLQTRCQSVVGSLLPPLCEWGGEMQQTNGRKSVSAL